jgi:hypothetical protein
MILAVIKDSSNIKILTDITYITDNVVKMINFKDNMNISYKHIFTIQWNKFINFLPLLEFKDKKIFIDALNSFKRHKLYVNYAIHEEENYIGITGFIINGNKNINKIIINEITDYLRQYSYTITAVTIDTGTKLIIK